VARRHGHISDGAHRDSNIRRRERRGVVDAIAGHRDPPSLCLQLRDHLEVVLRPYFAMDLVAAELFALRRKKSAVRYALTRRVYAL
jgi:hypothetical protein